MARRPVLVTIIGLLVIVIGVIQSLIGSLFLANQNDAQVLSDSGATSEQLSSLGTVLLLTGVISVIAAFSLLRGRRWARLLLLLVELGQIVGGVYALVTFTGQQQTNGIVSIAGGVIVIYFLYFTDKARTFFAR